MSFVGDGGVAREHSPTSAAAAMVSPRSERVLGDVGLQPTAAGLPGAQLGKTSLLTQWLNVPSGGTQKGGSSAMCPLRERAHRALQQPGEGMGD